MPVLKALQFDTGFQQASRQCLCAEVPQPSALVLVLADVHQAAEKSPGGDHYGPAHEVDIQARPAADDLALLVDQSGYCGLEHLQVRLEFQRMFEPELIGFFVALRARRLDGRTLGFIEQPELDSSDVRVDGHFTAEGVNLPDHLPLGLATDRRVAAHLGNRVDVASEEQGGGAHACGGQASLHPGVARPTDNHIERRLVIDHVKIDSLSNYIF